MVVWSVRVVRQATTPGRQKLATEQSAGSAEQDREPLVLGMPSLSAHICTAAGDYGTRCRPSSANSGAACGSHV